ncbi:MAG: protein kinase [Polyangiaceae bacterium]
MSSSSNLGTNRNPSAAEGHEEGAWLQTRQSNAPAPPHIETLPAPVPGMLGSHPRFEEREVLGSGGMGYVVRAFDKDLRREVAIKVLSSDCLSDPVEVDRFVQEARITGKLEHPHIVPVYEFGETTQGARFLCMKLVQGETLERVLRDLGLSRLGMDNLPDLLDIFVKVCDAVAFAHNHGVIHRDLKPANVMVSDYGQIYVVDWGVARANPTVHADMAGPEDAALTATDFESGENGSPIGTLCYMAPEQLRGHADWIDERTDVFGLGAILYQILTGKPPRTLRDQSLVVTRGSAHRVADPASLVEGALVPQELARIAIKAMAHSPEDRYASVKELKADVERFQRGTWRLSRRSFPAGTDIIHEGDVGAEAHIIVCGTCVAYTREDGRELILREMGPGDVYGETAVFAKRPRSASVRAVTDVEVMVVTSDMLSSALGLNQWMGLFVKALAERFLDVDERLRSCLLHTE